VAIFAGETARVRTELRDDDGKPAIPLPETVTLEIRSQDEVTVHIAATAMSLVVEDKGSLTAATSTTLTDTSQAWKVDQWKDACVRIVSGNGIGQERRIKSNTATVLTLDTKQVVNQAPVGPLNTVPVATDQYELHRSAYVKSYDVPADQAGKTLVAVVRAATTGANGYKAAEKISLDVEGASV
jgi:hypothetical protein